MDHSCSRDRSSQTVRRLCTTISSAKPHVRCVAYGRWVWESGQGSGKDGEERVGQGEPEGGSPRHLPREAVYLSLHDRGELLDHVDEVVREAKHEALYQLLHRVGRGVHLTVGGEG